MPARRIVRGIKGGTDRVVFATPESLRDVEVSRVKRVVAPQPGPQTQVLLLPHMEILYGGQRGGGKTVAGRMWLLKGNPDLPQDDPVNVSYIHHPGYTALIIRRNYTDLRDWITKTERFYFDIFPEGQRPVWSGDDSTFHWPSGARFVCGHLESDQAYQKYKGDEYQRILGEELTLIPKQELWDEIITSLRSPYPELRCQVFATTNPEGPGLQWVKQRFMTDPRTGKRVPPETTIRIPFVNPINGVTGEITRIFIPAGLKDNPKLTEADPLYAVRLMALPEAKRKAYLEGDWDAMEGATFFTDLRREARPDEPEWAYHVVPEGSVQFEKWDTRWGSLDWGYNHPFCFLHFIRNERDSRIYVASEFAGRLIDTYSMGHEWATRMRAELLEYEQPYYLWISHDAYGKYDRKARSGESVVEALQSGIDSVLGKSASLIVTDDEVRSQDDHMVDWAKAKQVRVVIRRAPNQRVPGWHAVLEALRWKAVATPVVYDHEYALRLAHDSPSRYHEYMTAVRVSQETPKGLPRMRFMAGCKRTLSCLESMVFDEDGEDLMKTDAHPDTGEGGDDPADALRYGLMGRRLMSQRIPEEEWFRRRLAEVQERHGAPLDGSQMTMVMRHLEQERSRIGQGPRLNHRGFMRRINA